MFFPQYLPKPEGSEGVDGAEKAPGMPSNKPTKIELPLEMRMQQMMTENCAVKSIVSGVMGFALGGLMGVFFASFEQMGPALPGTPGYTTQTLTMRETFRQMVTHTYGRASSQAKNFGMVGFMFAGTECIIEGYRGKNDVNNMLMAGCMTGGALGLRAGPTPAVVGCAGFAAFSFFMEKFLIHPD